MSGGGGAVKKKLARLCVRFRVADLDLALRRQTAVVGGEEDVESGDEVVVTGSRRVDELAFLLEGDRIPPVRKRDLLIGSWRHGLSEHDEACDRGDAEVARGAR